MSGRKSREQFLRPAVSAYSRSGRSGRWGRASRDAFRSGEACRVGIAHLRPTMVGSAQPPAVPGRFLAPVAFASGRTCAGRAPDSDRSSGAQKQDLSLCGLLREPVFVMQAAEYGPLYHPVSDRQPVSVRVGRHAVRRGLRQIGSQRRMRPATVIVRGPLPKNSVEMTFVERNQEVETFATKAPTH